MKVYERERFSGSGEKILVVDDDIATCRILKTRFAILNYQVVVAHDGNAALKSFEQENPDLVVLDVMLPGLDGYKVCEELRKFSNVPIIMLTALGDIGDRITGLQLGADDYLPKPFSPRELEARINSVLRRFKESPTPIPIGNPTVTKVGELRIDVDKRQVSRDKEQVPLTDTEFNLLELLIRAGGKTVSRTDLLKQLWGYPPQKRADLRVVDVYVARLRAKLEMDPRNPELIITDRGIGYAFQRLVQSAEAARA